MLKYFKPTFSISFLIVTILWMPDTESPYCVLISTHWLEQTVGRNIWVTKLFSNNLIISQYFFQWHSHRRHLWWLTDLLIYLFILHPHSEGRQGRTQKIQTYAIAHQGQHLRSALSVNCWGFTALRRLHWWYIRPLRHPYIASLWWWWLKICIGAYLLDWGPMEGNV